MDYLAVKVRDDIWSRHSAINAIINRGLSSQSPWCVKIENVLMVWLYSHGKKLVWGPTFVDTVPPTYLSQASKEVAGIADNVNNRKKKLYKAIMLNYKFVDELSYPIWTRNWYMRSMTVGPNHFPWKQSEYKCWEATLCERPKRIPERWFIEWNILFVAYSVSKTKFICKTSMYVWTVLTCSKRLDQKPTTSNHQQHTPSHFCERVNTKMLTKIMNEFVDDNNCHFITTIRSCCMNT